MLRKQLSKKVVIVYYTYWYNNIYSDLGHFVRRLTIVIPPCEAEIKTRSG